MKRISEKLCFRNSRKLDGKRGFGLLEVLAVIFVIGLLIALLLPAIQTAREMSRKSQCTNHLRELGLGLHGFQDGFGRFPPSSLIQSLNGTRSETWSWQVLLLPFVGNGSLFESLEIAEGTPLYGSGAASAALAGNSSVPLFVCPSYAGPRFHDEQLMLGALTNYKAIGATHLESLGRALPGQESNPLYAPSGQHPDGSIFPGESGLRLSEFCDGTSNTVVVGETIEGKFAIWTFGSQATVVGLPTSGRGAARFRYSTAGYYVPVASVDGSTADCLTFLGYPYSIEDRSSQNAVKGLGSNHHRVVNHLLADGSVHSISESIAPSAYMFLITRSGSEPIDHAL